jgi:hypothetical protein
MNIEQSYRKTVFMELYGICSFVKENSGDFMEVTEWSNGEGFDISLSAKSCGQQSIQLTWGEFKALKKLVKALNK